MRGVARFLILWLPLVDCNCTLEREFFAQPMRIGESAMSGGILNGGVSGSDGEIKHFPLNCIVKWLIIRSF